MRKARYSSVMTECQVSQFSRKLNGSDYDEIKLHFLSNALLFPVIDEGND
ncbi:MAG: hypothetical protein GVY17_10995 [Cyanobacteria bacterium]|nr:hypothetical protein [Cyanobacteria bacterium GSL.Bin21]